MSYITYLLFRFFTFPLQFLPYRVIHKLGCFLGLCVFHCYPKYRKRALSNLALATDLHLTPDQMVILAKKSLQSKAIIALEYPRLYREKNIHHIATCDNPTVAENILKTGKGVIFFCGHQANWELLFLEGTQRMGKIAQGVAIGRPIKNHYLYRWVVNLREKFGGKIIRPTQAYKECMKALKHGKFVGIVGDQGMPDSNYSCPFLGRVAWTSPLPALLSKRSGCPVIVATIRRENGKYRIHYSDPIEPCENIEIQMQQILRFFEASVKKCPHQWLWTHNKWKQQLPGKLKKQFRHDALALIFPADPEMISYLPAIRALYPREQITIFVPFPFSSPLVEVRSYHTIKELVIPDYRFKMVIDFTHNKTVQKHFSKLSALHVQAFKHPNDFLTHACR